MNRILLISVSVAALTACGVGPNSSKPQSASDALTSTAEVLEFETPTARHEMFSELARLSQTQAGSTGAVVFPVMRNGNLVAGPALEVRDDLLLVTDAGTSVVLVFATGALAFADDRRDSLQGLSEREATELIARSLLTRWAVPLGNSVKVERAPGVPYAAAYIDGVLRINPAFVYMAAAPATP